MQLNVHTTGISMENSLNDGSILAFTYLSNKWPLYRTATRKSNIGLLVLFSQSVQRDLTSWLLLFHKVLELFSQIIVQEFKNTSILSSCLMVARS